MVIVTARILIFAVGCSSSCPRLAAVEDCPVLCLLLVGGIGNGGLAIVAPIGG